MTLVRASLVILSSPPNGHGVKSCNINNAPAWVTSKYETTYKQRVEVDSDVPESLRIENTGGLGHLFVYFASLIISNTRKIRQMALDLDDGFKYILVKVGNGTDAAYSLETIKLLAHADTCVVMNTGNMLLHQYIITKYPSLVVYYVK